MLTVKQVTKVFNRNTPNQRVALDEMNFSLADGDFCIVIGTNGAGKSSVLNAIAGKFQVDTGAIHINDIDVAGKPVHQRAKWISRVFQDPMIGTAPTMTVAENMLLAELRGKKHRLKLSMNQERINRYRERLAKVGLGLEDRLAVKVGMLSGGQRQALSLLMAVSQKPDLLLLDEHTAALDPRTASLVMEATVAAVEELGLTTLMVTHNMQHAVDYGNRIAMLDAGKVHMEISGEEKQSVTVDELIKRFHITDDALLLG